MALDCTGLVAGRLVLGDTIDSFDRYWVEFGDMLSVQTSTVWYVVVVGLYRAVLDGH